MPDTPLKMLPARIPPPVRQMRASSKHNIRIDSRCITKRKLSEDCWLKTTSNIEVGPLVSYETTDEDNNLTVSTNLLNSITVRNDGILVSANVPELVGDGIIVSANVPELVGDQIISYHI